MTPNPILLVTGFEPFGSYASNPSWDAAVEAGKRLGGRVVARRLPVDYFPARDHLIAALEELNPFACLCIGQQPEAEFCMEQLARKPKEFASLAGRPLIDTTWPWSNTEEAFRSQAVPHRRSRDAGQYVCESTYWTLLNFGSARRPDMHMGFLHVPAISPLFPVQKTMEVVCHVVRAYVAAHLPPNSGQEVAVRL